MEERFFWILGFVLYTDVLFFAQMEHWAGPVVIGIFQMFGLAIAADRCGIKEVMPMFDKITSTMRGMVARKD